MRVTSAIVNDCLLLNAFLGNREREMNDGIGTRLSRQGADLERIQTFARIAVA